MNSESDQSEKVSRADGQMVKHGTGVNSRRAFPTNNYRSNLDPFVLFERFYIDEDKGFPMHPHKGFEILSYMIDGGMEHEDSLGVKHTAYEGSAMRITTGSGIEHSEFPVDGEPCNGLQLWVNLPKDRKEVEADYQDAEHGELPTEETDGATITTVVGEGSPIELHTEMEYFDIKVSDEWTWKVNEGWSGFVFGVEGEGKVNRQSFGKGSVLIVEEADEIKLEAEDGLRVVAVQRKPHDQEIRQQGPYVF